MGEMHLPGEERRIIEHQFYQAQLNLDEWMSLAATVLARTSRGAALVAPPRVHRCRFKHLQEPDPNPLADGAAHPGVAGGTDQAAVIDPVQCAQSGGPESHLALVE